MLHLLAWLPDLLQALAVYSSWQQRGFTKRLWWKRPFLSDHHRNHSWIGKVKFWFDLGFWQYNSVLPLQPWPDDCIPLVKTRGESLFKWFQYYQVLVRLVFKTSSWTIRINFLRLWVWNVARKDFNYSFFMRLFLSVKHRNYWGTLQ